MDGVGAEVARPPPRLVSVTSCGSDGCASASPARRAASLLFSLQFYVDRVALEPAKASPVPADALLLGFQLLQYEIVVFDAPVASAATSTEAAVTKMRHGKSCLFEVDADELLGELQRDEDAPLTLLLLAQEYGRARLRGFAAVPLSLHVGLLDEGSNLQRICEWASRSGSWELRDHHNEAVGSVTGAVTLSCLGKALAPHLAQALGVQVNKSRPSGPRVEEREMKTQEKRPAAAVVESRAGEEGAGQEKETADTDEEKAVEELKKVEKLDLSVQCDENMLNEEVAAAPLPLRNGVLRLDGEGRMGKTKSSTVEGHMLYYKGGTVRKGSISQRRISQRRSSRDSNYPRNVSAAVAAKGALLFPRELPPPLFFQKAHRRAKP